MKKQKNISQISLITKKSNMNNQQLELLSDVYNNYITYIHDVIQTEHQIYGNWYGKKEFINKCKTDNEFSETWGLKIEERELSYEERRKIFEEKTNRDSAYILSVRETFDEFKIPTKLITITYKDKTIQSYE